LLVLLGWRSINDIKKSIKIDTAKKYKPQQVIKKAGYNMLEENDGALKNYY